MDHLPPQDNPLVRRLSLIRSLSWRLYWLALALSLVTSGLVLWQYPDVRSASTARVVLVVVAPLVLPLVLTPVFFWMTLRRQLGWGERLTLFFLRLTLWLGVLWQLLWSVYWVMKWASGHGLLAGFPS